MPHGHPPKNPQGHRGSYKKDERRERALLRLRERITQAVSDGCSLLYIASLRDEEATLVKRLGV